jgi:2-amino-4-hydroxy-6-hydroxymethyldihydropteridine diphosphokinase
VVLSLGTNAGDREALMAAMERGVGEVLSGKVTFSPRMETRAVGVSAGGPPFLNRLVLGGFRGTPRELLDRCQQIENELGRQRPWRGAPRTADIDILLFGPAVVAEPDLAIPHPEIRNRRFCLEGLAALAPDLVPPGWGGSVREACAGMSSDVRSQAVTVLNGEG